MQPRCKSWCACLQDARKTLRALGGRGAAVAPVKVSSERGCTRMRLSSACSSLLKASGDLQHQYVWQGRAAGSSQGAEDYEGEDELIEDPEAISQQPSKPAAVPSK